MGGGGGGPGVGAGGAMQGGGGAGGITNTPDCSFFSWGDVGPVQVAATGDVQLGSLSGSELTVAWMTPAGDARYSDRARKSDTFDNGTALPASPGYYGLGRLALSDDGLRIVVLSSDLKQLAELSRASVGDAFTGTPSTGAFTAINADVGSSETLADPILSADDLTLYYSKAGGGTTTMYYATRASTSSAWQLGGSFAQPELQMQGNVRLEPTAISADELSLFYWHAGQGDLMMAIRPTRSSPFEEFGTAGPYANGQPDDACSRLYFTDHATSPSTIRYVDPP